MMAVGMTATSCRQEAPTLRKSDERDNNAVITVKRL
jgi:hypothetical protein